MKFTVTLLFLCSVVTLTACSVKPGSPAPTPVANAETRAVTAAKKLYDQQYASMSADQKKLHLSKGPCLSNEIIPDWVVDIAHEPRQPVDSDPANQCEAYRDGKAHHFIELDEEGNYIRAY